MDSVRGIKHLCLLVSCATLVVVTRGSLAEFAYYYVAYLTLTRHTGKNLLNAGTVLGLTLCPSITVPYVALAALVSETKITKSIDEWPMVQKMLNLPMFQAVFKYEVEYVTPSRAGESALFDFSDDHVDAREMAELMVDRESTNTYRVMTGVAAIGLVMYVFLGYSGLVMLTVFVIFCRYSPGGDGPDQWNVTVAARGDFNGPDGLYRVVRSGLFESRLRVGVAYAHEGVLQSRLHVTGHMAKSVTYQGNEIPAYYHNVHLDCVTWGGPPTFKTPKVGSKVIVELLPLRQDSTVVYTTRAEKDAHDQVIFKGLLTQGGVSGSPYFLVEMVYDPDADISVEKRTFGGCIGENYRHDKSTMMTTNGLRWQAEIVKNGGELNPMRAVKVESGGSYQIISYPGSGKTRVLAASIITESLPFCGNIILAGPTRVVAGEMYSALCNRFSSVSLNIKGSTNVSRYAKVIITTHGTLMAMIHKNDVVVRANSGFIIDESHFTNSKTMMLLAFLRNRFAQPKVRGMYVEMTATGFDMQKRCPTLSEGSNYHIEDIPYTGTVLERTTRVAMANPGKRIIVFCPSVKGRDSVMQLAAALAKTGVKQRIIQLYREVYSVRAGSASDRDKYPEGIILLTTNIAECGANYFIDIVIDTCKQLRCTKVEDNVYRFCMRPITVSQYIQRRGRTGRHTNGIYYYPSTYVRDEAPALAYDDDVEYLDKAEYMTYMGFMDEFGMRPDCSANLSAAQMHIWLTSMDQDGPNSSRMLRLLFKMNGVRCTNTQLGENIKQQLLGGSHPVNIGGKILRVQWWDDRDSAALIKLLKRFAILDAGPDDMEEAKPVLKSFRVDKYVLEKVHMDYDDPDLEVNGIPMVVRPMIPRHMRETSTWLGGRQFTFVDDEDIPSLEGQ